MRIGRIKILIPSTYEWNGDNLPLIDLPMYTDGSKMEDGTEAEVFCEQQRMAYFYKLDGKYRVFQVQIFAIRKPTVSIKNMEDEVPEPVTIFVEIQPTLKAIESSTIKFDAVLRGRTDLGNLHTTIWFCLVPFWFGWSAYYPCEGL